MKNHSKSKFVILIIASLGIGLLCPVLSHASHDFLNQGQTAFDKGQFAQAIQYWEQALVSPDSLQVKRLDTLIQLSAAYQALGFFDKAQTYLEQALKRTQNDFARTMLINSKRCDLYLAAQETGEAQDCICDLYLATQKTREAQECVNKINLTLEQVHQLGQPLLSANVLLSIANVSSVQDNNDKALQYYQESANYAAQAGDLLLSSKALTNSVQVHLEIMLNLQGFKNLEGFISTLNDALQRLQSVPDSYDKALVFLAIAQLALRAQEQVSTSKPWNQIIYSALNHALQWGNTAPNYTITSYAYGYLGKLYALNERFEEALHLTRRALFFAQQQKTEVLLYQWYWQLGRLLKTQGKVDDAIVAMCQAVKILMPPLRHDLIKSQQSLKVSDVFFDESIKPVYVELADLLLQKAANTNQEKARQTLLQETRNTLEQLKVVELQYYFKDECITQWLASQQQIDKVIQIKPHTAVLYPVILTNRVELLLSLPNEVIKQESAIVAEKVDDVIEGWNVDLPDKTNQDFSLAQLLYRWLIRPIEHHLSAHQIDTLVIVPDSQLATIPFASLHDGKQFLIEKYAFATTPGLTLTDPTPFRERENVQVMLNGLSIAKPKFSALPQVQTELNDIQKIYRQSVLFLNQEFSIPIFETELRKTPYTIIHIASHVQFDRDTKQSFILTYDDKLTLNKLENLLQVSQFRYKNPLELLTLSACQTAQGNDKAALGLAGIAIKAGARSALASLWQVADESTSELVVEFYKQLKNNQLSKAKALQKAQLHLLTNKKYSHPYYWAAFLLIGNWL